MIWSCMRVIRKQILDIFTGKHACTSTKREAIGIQYS